MRVYHGRGSRIRVQPDNTIKDRPCIAVRSVAEDPIAQNSSAVTRAPCQ
jgi:hypothetical protein